jgi:hypothetical protein
MPLKKTLATDAALYGWLSAIKCANMENLSASQYH